MDEREWLACDDVKTILLDLAGKPDEQQVFSTGSRSLCSPR